MQQYEAFGRLAKEDRAIDDIAAYFGVTDLEVKRILALANLHEDIRDGQNIADILGDPESSLERRNHW